MGQDDQCENPQKSTTPAVRPTTLDLGPVYPEREDIFENSRHEAPQVVAPSRQNGETSLANEETSIADQEESIETIVNTSATKVNHDVPIAKDDEIKPSIPAHENGLYNESSIKTSSFCGNVSTKISGTGESCDGTSQKASISTEESLINDINSPSGSLKDSRDTVSSPKESSLSVAEETTSKPESDENLKTHSATSLDDYMEAEEGDYEDVLMVTDFTSGVPTVRRLKVPSYVPLAREESKLTDTVTEKSNSAASSDIAGAKPEGATEEKTANSMKTSTDPTQGMSLASSVTVDRDEIVQSEDFHDEASCSSAESHQGPMFVVNPPPDCSKLDELADASLEYMKQNLEQYNVDLGETLHAKLCPERFWEVPEFSPTIACQSTDQRSNEFKKSESSMLSSILILLDDLMDEVDDNEGENEAASTTDEGSGRDDRKETVVRLPEEKEKVVLGSEEETTLNEADIYGKESLQDLKEWMKKVWLKAMDQIIKRKGENTDESACKWPEDTTYIVRMLKRPKNSGGGTEDFIFPTQEQINADTTNFTDVKVHMKNVWKDIWSKIVTSMMASDADGSAPVNTCSDDSECLESESDDDNLDSDQKGLETENFDQLKREVNSILESTHVETTQPLVTEEDEEEFYSYNGGYLEEESEESDREEYRLSKEMEEIYAKADYYFFTGAGKGTEDRLRVEKAVEEDIGESMRRNAKKVLTLRKMLEERQCKDQGILPSEIIRSEADLPQEALDVLYGWMKTDNPEPQKEYPRNVVEKKEEFKKEWLAVCDAISAYGIPQDKHDMDKTSPLKIDTSMEKSCIDPSNNESDSDDSDSEGSNDESDSEGSIDESDSEGSMDESDSEESMDESDSEESMDESDSEESMDESDGEGSSDESDSKGSSDELDGGDPNMHFSNDELHDDNSNDEWNDDVPSDESDSDASSEEAEYDLEDKPELMLLNDGALSDESEEETMDEEAQQKIFDAREKNLAKAYAKASLMGFERMHKRRHLTDECALRTIDGILQEKRDKEQKLDALCQETDDCLDFWFDVTNFNGTSMSPSEPSDSDSSDDSSITDFDDEEYSSDSSPKRPLSQYTHVEKLKMPFGDFEHVKHDGLLCQRVDRNEAIKETLLNMWIPTHCRFLRRNVKSFFRQKQKTRGLFYDEWEHRHPLIPRTKRNDRLKSVWFSNDGDSNSVPMEDYYMRRILYELHTDEEILKQKDSRIWKWSKKHDEWEKNHVTTADYREYYKMVLPTWACTPEYLDNL